MTEKLVNLIGLQRCGCHAVANWILHQHNTVMRSYELKEYPNEIKEQNEVWGFNIYKTFLLFNQYWFKYQEPHAPTKLGYTPKEVANAVIVYETGELGKYNIDFDNKKEVFGNIESESTVIVLRDFLNCAASWYRQHGEVPRHIAIFWYDRAMEILNKTWKIPCAEFINYNYWFTNKDYRKHICEKLSLYFTDIGINTVAHFGNGSSFNKREYDGCAQLMDVNNRWKLLEHNEEFIEYLKPYRELVQLSERIFGEYK